MVCKRCGAKIPLRKNESVGKCKFCGREQKLKSAEEEKFDAEIFAKQASLDDFNAKLKDKLDEKAMIKKTYKLAVHVIIVFVIFLLSWHFGSERSFRRNTGVLILVSIFVIPGFVVGYLGGSVLTYKLARSTSRSPHAAIVFAICTFNAYGVYVAIHFISHSNYLKINKEIDGLTQLRDKAQNELDKLKQHHKQLFLT
ncbi:MAG: hypothetical protein E7353_07180 [Clostridiales bacterium]|nr:hypothetical protein [Clostridiales bacterium]